jgi:hypothetical protein
VVRAGLYPLAISAFEIAIVPAGVRVMVWVIKRGFLQQSCFGYNPGGRRDPVPLTSPDRPIFEWLFVSRSALRISHSPPFFSFSGGLAGVPSAFT